MALFGGSRPDHPMADIKQAKKLIADLPANDSVKALEEIAFWLDSLNRTEGFRVDLRFQIVDLLDQTAKLHQRKVSQEYLLTQRLQKFQENKLWTAVFDFWRLLANGYSLCIEQFQSGASGSGGIKNDLPAIVARVLRALTLQLKWVLLRYGPTESRIWGELGRLYHFAETKKFAVAVIQIYPGQHGQSSVRQEFLKALMLSVSSTDGLNPIQQEIAERTVAHFGGMYTLQEKPGPGCNFFFDLSMRKPPARVQKNSVPDTMMRFFGAGKALAGLSALIHETRQKEGIPADVNLGGNYETEVVLGVMQHLALYWSDEPPARSSERRKVATRLTVVHGYDEILRSVDPAADGAASEFEQVVDSESWIVENASEGGFGAIIPQVKGDWIKIGAVLGVQTETAKSWSAGVIRRITSDEHQQRRVGIQLLGRAAIPVRLAPAGMPSSGDAAREGAHALLLSTTPDKNGEIALLLKVGRYTSDQSLDMHVRDKTYLLMPSKLTEGGQDFDCAKFKVMQRA